MKVGNIGTSVPFGHKILIDIGASNPKGTMKCTVKSDDGRTLYQTNGYLNNSTEGFKKTIDPETGKLDGGQQDFISKIDDVILAAHKYVVKNAGENGVPKFSEIPRYQENDKKLSGVAVFVPGTTYTNHKDDKVAFIPNLKNTDGESLTNIDFHTYEEELKDPNGRRREGLDINDDRFEMIVTKDLGGTGLALSKILADKKQLNHGDYIMGVMTGGGFGSVDIKVKGKPEDPIVEIETSESSSYLSGNIALYDQMFKKVNEILNGDKPIEKLRELTGSDTRELKELIPVLGKLGRQGVSVKSHIKYYFEALKLDVSKEELDNLIDLTQKVGDARIVCDNKMHLNNDPDTKDQALIDKIRDCKYFKEVKSDDPSKLTFTLNPDVASPEKIKNARIETINEYASAVSLISINKINDCINKVILVGPFAQGLNKHIQEHQDEFGVKDLPELIMQKIDTNTDEKHVDLPSTRRLMELYGFEVICDPGINFPNNTYAGEVLLDNRLQFVPNRGSWFSIPLNELKQY